MKKIFFIALVATIWGCVDQPEVSLVKPELVIISDNETGNPMLFAIEENYRNLGAHQQISLNPTDTIIFPLVNPYEYLYISHKESYGDTLMVAAGDTLRVRTKKDGSFLFNYSGPGREAIAGFQTELQRFGQDQDMREIQMQLDSVRDIFYLPGSVMPAIEMFNDFQKFSSGKGYLMNKEAFEQDTASIHIWIGLHGQRYSNTASFLRGLGDEYDQALLDREQQRARYDYYRQLMIIQRNARKDTIRSLMDSELFFHADLLNDPHARGYLVGYLIQHLTKQRRVGSRSQEYVDYREAFDSIPGHFTDSLAKFARYLSLESMASFEESYIEMANRYEQFKETYRDTRLNKVLEDRFLLDIATYRNVTDDVKLVDQKHGLASLSDLMKGYTGQVVYLDLWASWCAPCREGLPHSRELARDFRDKPLKIIYL